MVIADRQHQIASGLVEVSAHDRSRCGNVEAAIVNQANADAVRRCPRRFRQLRDPARVDLHHAEILRAIGIPMHGADRTAFDRLDRGQYTRRQMIESGDTGHAGKQRDAHDRGFTLLELLVVIVILGLLIGLVAPAALRQLGSARASVARESIQRLESVLDLYKLDVGDYPSTEQGLQALIERPSDVATWNGPYLKDSRSPVDPWNHPYQYRNPSTRSGHDYDLCSAGPPGGTAGQNAICNP
jgi:general secretion pathway protein G